MRSLILPRIVGAGSRLQTHIIAYKPGWWGFLVGPLSLFKGCSGFEAVVLGLLLRASRITTAVGAVARAGGWFCEGLCPHQPVLTMELPGMTGLACSDPMPFRNDSS